MKLIELIAFVKDQEEFHRTRAEAFKDKTFRRDKHLETAAKLNGVLRFLEASSQKRRSPEQISFHLTPEDIDGLPEELLSELSITEADKAEFAILGIFEESGGTLSLDQLLVRYFRTTGEILKRPAMNNRIYRMIQKGVLFSVPNRKGIYTISAPKETETPESLGLVSGDP